MSFRPDLPSGLNLGRRVTTPVKLPKMSFPMIGGVPETPVQPGPETAPTPAPEAVPQSPPQAPPAPQGSIGPAAPAAGGAPTNEEVGLMQDPTADRAPARQPMEMREAVALPRENSRVIVYGRSGCDLCLAAITDLIERQVCFQYHDVTRDEKAMQHLKAICGGSPVVPVIISIGMVG